MQPVFDAKVKNRGVLSDNVAREVGNGSVATAIHSQGIELTDPHNNLHPNDVIRNINVTIKLGNTE